MLFNRRYKVRVLIYGAMMLATILGVYGQDISYYMNSNIVKSSPKYYLTISTIISVLLFLVPAILVYKFNRKQKIKDKGVTFYLGINTLIGVMTSAFSLLVLIMWWG